MENDSITPEEFIETLEKLAKTIREKDKEIQQDNSDFKNELDETPYKINIGFSNGSKLSVTIEYVTLLEFFKAIKNKYEYFIGLDIDKDPFLVRISEIAAVLTEEKDE